MNSSKSTVLRKTRFLDANELKISLISHKSVFNLPNHSRHLNRVGLACVGLALNNERSPYRVPSLRAANSTVGLVFSGVTSELRNSAASAEKGTADILAALASLFFNGEASTSILSRHAE